MLEVGSIEKHVGHLGELDHRSLLTDTDKFVAIIVEC